MVTHRIGKSQRGEIWNEIKVAGEASVFFARSRAFAWLDKTGLLVLGLVVRKRWVAVYRSSSATGMVK